jgi:pimeloyl-ACP methyl ester carboxylesterase
VRPCLESLPRLRRRDFVEMLSAVPLMARAVPANAPYEDALARVRRMHARDDERILGISRTAFLTHGRTTDLAVVLFHGFTNSPAQYALFAQQLHARGCNVLIPRLPEHGDVDRMTTRLEGLTAERLVAAASEAIDAAQGLGRKIAVSGISLGGVLCTWLATQRADIDRAVVLAPAFGIGHVLYPVSVYAAGVMRAMPPSRYVWWDPVLKEKITPNHAYPRYPLHTLGECYKIGELTIGAQPPFPGRARTHVIFALNPNDPAVNNDVVAELSDRWRDSGVLASSVFWLQNMPMMHDIIEPENPHQCIASCYPPLIEAILSA